MIAGMKRLENWLWGLCGGLLVAVACLFCVSGWGMVVTTRGMSPGALVFYGSWLLCLGAALFFGPRVAGLGMGYAQGLAWLFAALGSLLRASDAMRLHPVVMGVNLVFCVFGLVALGLTFRYQRRAGAVQ